LADAVNGNGSYVFERSEVTSINDGELAQIKTNKAAVTAKDIIVATNVPTLPLVARGSYCVLEYPKESYVVAGRIEKQYQTTSTRTTWGAIVSARALRGVEQKY